MAKWNATTVLNAALDYIDDCTLLVVCSAQPTSYAEATTLYDGGAGKYMIASHVLAGGDFTDSVGDAGGQSRKVRIAEQAAIAVSASATATHVALCISGTSELVYVTTCTSQALTSGNTVTVPAFDIEFGAAA